MKTSCYGIKNGDTLILNTSGVYEGIHIDKGTEIKVSGFPPKVRKNDRTDKNSNGYIRDYFVIGTTLNGITIRENLNKFVKPLC